ncbi:hypothetical protein [Achromobacter sp. ESBL13]|uniref:hypothetical protein n=1 Tax=Achromobacter sp. ESBL13 TaxID=3077328 RepID=UPI002FC918E9
MKENLSNFASQDSRLAAAVNGSGTKNPNFSIGQGTSFEDNQLGKIWIGDDARPISGVPGGFISADGARVYRPPTKKPNTPAKYNPTGVQANWIKSEYYYHGAVVRHMLIVFEYDTSLIVKESSNYVGACSGEDFWGLPKNCLVWVHGSMKTISRR